MFTGTLFPYQEDGVQAILDVRRILVAYSMGTGKTVLTIAAMEELFGNGDICSVLLLVPSSLKWQWAQSLAQFTDSEQRQVVLKGMPIMVPVEDVCMVINGTPAKRREQWERALEGGTDYVIASYGAVLNDWQWLRLMQMDALILDEATVIKNFSSRTSKRIKKIQPDTRVALTGTPVENRPEDIFSIMEWVNRLILGRWDHFDKSFIVRNWFGGVKGYKNLELLHRNLQKAMIRKSRLDPEVQKYLPRVAETTRTVTLDKQTKKFYKRITSDLAKALEELVEQGQSLDLAAYYAGASAEREHGAQGKVMARLLAARLLLDHPALLMDSAVAFHEQKGEGSEYIADLVASSAELADLKPTPKLDMLDLLVDQMVAENAKVAVFTSYRRMLPHMAERLDKYGDLVTFHGGMNSDQKAGAKARFQQDPQCRLFLSTNAGGYGLDLPECQYLINYDLPDSKGVLDQRNTRHVRASSKHACVYVVNLVVEDSVEERQQATLRMRGALAAAIVDGRGDTRITNDIETLTEHLGRIE